MPEGFREITDPADQARLTKQFPVDPEKKWCLSESGTNKRCTRRKGHEGTAHVWHNNYTHPERALVYYQWFA
jgi:hypothetical protein